MEKNVVGWFEIPVLNMERAIKFYETIFGYTLARHTLPQIDMAWFPMNPDGMGAMGSLVYNEKFYKPSTNGTLVYFTAVSGDLDTELSKVENAGGTVTIQKTKISDDYGFMAQFIDTEGNGIAIHSRK